MPDLLERLAAALGDRYAIEREVGRGSSGRTGYESGRCAFFICETPGGTISGTDWVRIGNQRATDRIQG